MLDEFIRANRGEIHERARALAEAREAVVTASALPEGVSSFIDQLIDRLCGDRLLSDEIVRSARAHGGAMLREGHRIDEVVRRYGDVCQAVTELAVERDAPITAREFRRFNHYLDVAMSEAAREYVRQRDRSASEHETERMGVLAHELRNQLSNATIAFELLARGSIGISGSTGALLGRGLRGLRETIDRALAGVRGDAPAAPRERIRLASVLGELELPGVVEAESRHIRLIVERGDTDVEVEVARQALLSAVWNLVQNALKFTRPSGTVTVRTQLIGTRVVIDVVDQCGGLPAGGADALFRPFEQRGTDRSGLGLGLAISRREVEANGGAIHVQDVPGEGCVFSIDLPRVNVTGGL